MLARARYAHGEFLSIFVKSVKTLKSHATAKILKMVKSTWAFGRGQNFSKVVKIFAPPKSYPPTMIGGVFDELLRPRGPG